MANDNNNIQITDESQIVLYQPNESISLQVKIDASHDTVWLTQQQIARVSSSLFLKTSWKHPC